jgi:ribose-phosphate pyrophosphokinase
MADISLARTRMLLVSGTANRPLAEGIGERLGQPLCAVTIRRFADGEIFVKFDENVRGQDVFIVQPTNPPGDNILELLLLIDAAKRASAARTTAVIPYFGYARQDRKDQPRVAISAKLMANLVETAGAERVLGLDFHQHQLQGFFDIPVDHLYCAPVFTQHFRQKKLKDPVVVAPDVGSAKMARGFARRLDAGFAIIDKRRPSPNVAEVLNVVGEVDGRDCLIVDDMIDTGGTVTEAARALKRLGAKDVYCCASHALLSGPAVERLIAAPITEVVVSNTVHIPESRRFERLTVLSIAPLLAQAIRYTHSDRSVSALFEESAEAPRPKGRRADRAGKKDADAAPAATGAAPAGAPTPEQ